jgi:hypothetical protein
MKDLNEAIQELENIVESKISEYPIPHKKGNSIRIGHVVVRKSKSKGYIVFNSNTNKPVATTFSIIGALAVAKATIKKSPIGTLIQYDSIIEKNYNDSQFYYHIIQGRSNELRKKAVESRLEISKNKIDRAKEVLDNFVMNNL